MSAEIHNTAIIHEGAELGKNVKVGPYCIVGENVKIGDDCILRAHVQIDGHTTIQKGNEFYPYSTIGFEPQDLSYKGEPTRLEVGENNIFREFASIHRGTLKDNEVTIIGDDNLFMAYTHIGHDAVIGSKCVFVNGVGLAGHVKIGDKTIISGGSNISQFVTIGRGAYIGGASAVDRDIPAFCTAYGNRIRLKGINIIGLRRQGYSKQEISEIVDFYRTMEASALSPRAFVVNDEAMGEFAENSVVTEISNFIEKSDIGIAPFIS